MTYFALNVAAMGIVLLAGALLGASHASHRAPLLAQAPPDVSGAVATGVGDILSGAIAQGWAVGLIVLLFGGCVWLLYGQFRAMNAKLDKLEEHRVTVLEKVVGENTAAFAALQHQMESNVCLMSADRQDRIVQTIANSVVASVKPKV